MDDHVGLLAAEAYKDVDLVSASIEPYRGYSLTNHDNQPRAGRHRPWYSISQENFTEDEKRWLPRAFVLSLLAVILILALCFVDDKSGVIDDSSPYLVSSQFKTGCGNGSVRYTWTLRQILSSKEFNTSIITINDSSIGPMVELCVGQYLVIVVENELDEDVAIHWHGISQYESNSQDGVPAVTQAGIAPGQAQQYSFQVEEAGTYWWHAHSGLLRLRGLYGAFIVHSLDETQDFVARLPDPAREVIDYVLLVGDYDADIGKSYTKYMSSGNVLLSEPMPSSMVANAVLYNGTTMKYVLPKPVFKARFWRLRIVNVGAFAEIKVSRPAKSDGMHVLEADSGPVRTTLVTSLSVAVGQRYSVLLDTDNYKIDEDILIQLDLDLGDHTNAHNKGHNHHIHGARMSAADAASASPETSLIHLHDGMLHPPAQGHEKYNISSSSDLLVPSLFVLTLGMSRRNGITRSTINAQSYIPQNHPLVEEYTQNAMHYNVTALSNKYAPDILSLSILQGEEILVLFKNDDGGSHPMHIHGHKMQVLATASFFYDPRSTSSMRRISRTFDEHAIPSLLRAERFGNDLERPIWRDTVNVASKGWTLVRLVGAGKGVWSLHCHNSWHEKSGMAMVLEVR